MRPDSSAWKQISRIARKETTLFFTSPVAYLFLASFAAVSLFAVFWGEAFFARNIADARPLFEWMPVLLIFLSAALTMRLWSEERRTGTLEHVLTSPVPLWQFVAGKFLACLTLLACALAITAPFPVTVAFLGDLDWGPVVSGYLATFLLGATYLAVGLFVSSQSGNQIVSLLGTIALSGILYLVGSPAVTGLFEQHWAELLQSLGTGSRFESITRGVVDLRDLAYYLGLTLTFLSLNAYCLESERWTSKATTARQTDWRTIVALIAANALGLNLWIGQLDSLRVDMTEGDMYSLSEVTERQLESLVEPLTIKAYFSQKTHPLLAPLVPQLRDLLKEYEVAGHGKVRVEFIDPQQDPDAEQEAQQEFGIEPVPFQVADRYEASIVSSYFNVVVKYGDSFEVLGFKELIEVKGHAAENFDVHLRNPEYDITRAIKKAVNEYQKQGEVFDAISRPVILRMFVSEELPENLGEFKKTVESVTREFEEKSQGKFSLEVLDPEKDHQAGKLADDYGLRPLAQNLLGQKSFYFYLLLSQGDRLIQIPLEDLSATGFKRNLQAALKKFATGFAKTLAVHSGEGRTPRELERFLGEELNVVKESLDDGTVDGAADVLLLLSPNELKPKELYAVDQFLMRGGTVVACTSGFQPQVGSRNLSVQAHESGLEDWLRHHGVEIGDQLVEDTQCASLPIPVTRYMRGMPVQEVRLIDYPYFLDLRQDNFQEDNPALADLQRLVLPWASPISFAKPEGSQLNYQVLLKSGKQSWLNSSTMVMPQVDEYGRTVVSPGGNRASHTLGLMVSGQFKSYFSKEKSEELEDLQLPTLTNSPESARLIVLASPSMFNDEMVRLFSGLGGGDSLNNLNFLANLFDWVTQDESLLGIRSRSHFKRTLYPLDRGKQMMWEYLNYFLALLMLAVIGAFYRLRIAGYRARYRQLLDS